MCGIAGMILPQGNPTQPVLKRMCDSIAHRGPDDEGFLVDGICAVGMRRLSIIDLALGHQPMSNEDGTVWIVFNGEVYNFHELRADLESRGHKFRTHSDTEAVIHNFEEYGIDGFDRLRGMFAFAIWDSRKKRLTLARDRFGKKPLYYKVHNGGLYFGSELKCLHAAGIPLEINLQGLKLYFQHAYIPDPHSPFAGVEKLPGGGWLTFDASGRIQQGRYWRLPRAAEGEPANLSREEARERVAELFDESVRLRMISDVPLGAFLSGGLDSSSVVASMAKQSTEPVRTFTIGFEEGDFSELPLARLVAEKFQTEHHEIIVKPDAIALLERLVRAFDEPFGDSSSIPTYVVSEFARKHVKVVLSGDGGDEIFAGYVEHRIAAGLGKWDQIPGPIRKAISAMSDVLPYSTYGKSFLRNISRSSVLERYFDRISWPYAMRKELLSPEWMLPGDEAFFRKLYAESLLPDGANILTQALYFEAITQLSGDMLVKVDRASSANSLEVRCPLLDHRLAEFAATIPHAWKIEGDKGKVILREALGARLPQELLSAPKRGFGVPLVHWFKNQLKDFTHDLLLSKSFLERGIVSPSVMKRVLKEHESGRRDNCRWIYSLLMLEMWFHRRTGSGWD